MLASFSNKTLRVTGLTAWVLLAFIVAQVLSGLLYGLFELIPAVKGLNTAVTATLSSALAYVAATLVVIGIPYLLNRDKINLKMLGIQRPLSWSDIGFSLLALLPYVLTAALLGWLFTYVFGLIDPNQKQAIPFENLVLRYEYLVAFITLVIMAPIAEELLFRGYFLGRMATIINPWVGVGITAVAFGLLHVPGFTSSGQFQLQWGAMVDTLSLGLVLGSLRLLTGSIWAGVVLHMIKNFIAYFFLFIYPNVTGTM